MAATKTLRATLKERQREAQEKVTWILLYWEEEMSISIHCQSELIDVQYLEEGALCKVQFGKEAHEGKIAAIGSKSEMLKLEKDFCKKKYTPFKVPQNESTVCISEESSPKKRKLTEQNQIETIVIQRGRRRTKKSSKENAVKQQHTRNLNKKRNTQQHTRNSNKKRNTPKKKGKILTAGDGYMAYSSCCTSSSDDESTSIGHSNIVTNEHSDDLNCPGQQKTSTVTSDVIATQQPGEPNWLGDQKTSNVASVVMFTQQPCDTNWPGQQKTSNVASDVMVTQQARDTNWSGQQKTFNVTSKAMAAQQPEEPNWPGQQKTSNVTSVVMGTQQLGEPNWPGQHKASNVTSNMMVAQQSRDTNWPGQQKTSNVTSDVMVTQQPWDANWPGQHKASNVTSNMMVAQQSRDTNWPGQQKTSNVASDVMVAQQSEYTNWNTQMTDEDDYGGWSDYDGQLDYPAPIDIDVEIKELKNRVNTLENQVNLILGKGSHGMQCNSSVSTTPVRRLPTHHCDTMPVLNTDQVETSPNVNKLLPPQNVVRKHCKLNHVSKMPTLAVKLARESFFGDDVMMECTVQGYREQPPLPTESLRELKSFLEHIFHNRCTLAEFEGNWKQCIKSIGQACKTLRLNAKKK